MAAPGDDPDPAPSDTRPAHLRNRFNKLTKEQREVMVRRQMEREAAWRNPPWRCGKCGDVENGGTYGVIFQHTVYPNRVVKAARDPFADGMCPPSVTHEYTMYTRVIEVLDRLRTSSGLELDALAYFKVASVYSHYVENDRCFIEMDAIRPWNNLEAELSMLALGLDPEARELRGGATGRGWRELGPVAAEDVLDRALGLSLEDFQHAQGAFVGACHASGIVPQDIEYFIARVDNRPCVAIVDFDKVFTERPGEGYAGEGGTALSVINNKDRLAQDIAKQDMYNVNAPSFGIGYVRGALALRPIVHEGDAERFSKFYHDVLALARGM